MTEGRTHVKSTLTDSRERLSDHLPKGVKLSGPATRILHGVLAERVPVTVSRLVQTPVGAQQEVAGLEKELGLRYVPLLAIAHHNDPLDIERRHDTPAINATISGALTFSLEDPTHPKQGSIDTLNVMLDQQRRKWAFRRLLYDRPPEELESVTQLLGYAGAATAGGELLQVLGSASHLHVLGQVLEGTALAITGQGDDIITAYAVGGIRDDSLAAIVKNNKLVWGAILSSGLLDMILPAILKSPNIDVRLLGGGLYTFSSAAGSLAANVNSFRASKKAIRSLDTDQKLSRATVNTLALRENLSHPLNRWLGVGLIASAATAIPAGAFGLIVNPETGGIVSGVIGSIETAITLAGTKLEDTVRRHHTNKQFETQ